MGRLKYLSTKHHLLWYWTTDSNFIPHAFASSAGGVGAPSMRSFDQQRMASSFSNASNARGLERSTVGSRIDRSVRVPGKRCQPHGRGLDHGPAGSVGADRPVRRIGVGVLHGGSPGFARAPPGAAGLAAGTSGLAGGGSSSP